MVEAHVVWNLVAQQLARRYRRAWLGLAWITLVPLAQMSVMGVAFSLIFRIRTIDLIAHILVSLLPFTLFQTTVTCASSSLVEYQEILRRHNVTRVVFPVSAALLAVIEYLIASVGLVVLAPLLQIKLSVAMIAVPLGFLCICFSALGLGMLGAIGSVRFRDLSHLITVILNLLYWVTPIVYMLRMVPERVRGYYYVNPLVSMLAMYTDPLIHGKFPAQKCLIIGPTVAVVLFLLGCLVFQRNAKQVVFHL